MLSWGKTHSGALLGEHIATEHNHYLGNNKAASARRPFQASSRHAHGWPVCRLSFTIIAVMPSRNLLPTASRAGARFLMTSNVLSVHSSGARSAPLSRRRAACIFSSRWETEDVPGMGSITGSRRIRGQRQLSNYCFGRSRSSLSVFWPILAIAEPIQAIAWQARYMQAAPS
jgi:hypothetical protein